MENPRSWGEAERVVDRAIVQHGYEMARGVYGHSLTITITNALRKAGLLDQKEVTR